MKDPDLIYKVDVPVYAYVYRALLAIILILLFVMKVDYEILIVAIIIAFLLWSNSNYYHVEIYPDRFNLVLPDFMFNLLKIEKVYFYKHIKNYTFNSAKFDKSKFLLWGVVASIIFPYANTTRFYYRFPIMKFDYDHEAEEKPVEKRFSLLQNTQLLQASQHIEKLLQH